jgi:hypothetical protein
MSAITKASRLGQTLLELDDDDYREERFDRRLLDVKSAVGKIVNVLAHQPLWAATALFLVSLTCKLCIRSLS